MGARCSRRGNDSLSNLSRTRAGSVSVPLDRASPTSAAERSAAAAVKRTRNEPMMPTKEKKRDDNKKRLKGLQIFRRSKSKPALSPTPLPVARSSSVSASTDDSSPPPADGARDSISDGSSLTADPEPSPAPTELGALSPLAEWTPLPLASVGPSSVTVTTISSPADGEAGAVDGRVTEQVRQVGELEVQIRQTTTDVDRVTVQGNRDNVDPNIIRAMIMDKMRGMGSLKGQMPDMQGEPVVTLPETPQNGLSGGHKSGPLAKVTAFPTSPDSMSNAKVTSNNTSTRFASQRSQVLSTRATTSSSSSTSSELKTSVQADASDRLAASSCAQSELQNFNRKVSQTQIGASNGLASDVTCVTSTTRAVSSQSSQSASLTSTAGVRGVQAGAARAALQSQTSAASLASAANVRQLAKSFDSLKNLSMDKLKDSLSMEKLDDRDLLNIELGGDDGASRDPNVQVFEQKQSYSTSNKKLVTNDFSTEEATANSEEMTRLQEGDNSYHENKASSDMRARLEMNGVTAEKGLSTRQVRPAGDELSAIAEKGLSTRQEARQLKAGDVTHQESRSAAVAGAKLSTDGFSTQKVAMEQNQQRQTTAAGVVNQEQRSKKSTHSKVTINKQQGVTTPTSPAVAFAVEELDRLERSTSPLDVGQAVIKCSHHMAQMLRGLDQQEPSQQLSMFDQMDTMMRRAWSVPTYGHELGNSLCDVMRDNGGLDVLMRTCNTGSKEVDLKSARVLEQCLTTENRQYVVERGLDNVVRSACRTCAEKADERESRVGSGILEHLFKHSEGTCSDVVRMGGLDAVITQCKNKDLETLRHCASALANLSLYGGPENQQAMMKRKVPSWLFPLAFHNDDNIKYYACLAITSMVANKEIEAAVLKSGTLELVEPFVTSHDPDQFSKSTVAHVHGQSRSWLKRLVPVLLSDREEARKLAAFHFCMEAGIKIRQGCPEIFEEIGAIEPLKQVASSPNAVASKYAAQALRLLGEEVPHKLSQQVPLWSVEDVKEWVKQINFSQFADDFVRSRMDGDLLLRMTEDMLKDDIAMANGILRNRFMRELSNLKKMADYSSCDSTGLNTFLQSISPEFSVYTYPMLTCGVDKDCLRYLTDEQLQFECDISNSIHRLRIHEAIKNESAPPEVSEDMDKTLDCFISYRRSNGSQLASLLKVHLELRGFSVFIDVERLEAGKFDNNLLNSIRQAKNFILVLTPSALDRCIQDYDQKDWVHKEVYAALQSKCNIIPIIDNFQWPEADELPEDIKSVCTFNGVRWIHDYQEACVDKLERFMRGELNRSDGRYGGHTTGPGTPSTRPPPHPFLRTQSSESARDA
ncbi:LOW QUALITY PROTEIN: NAD(+) hydrolase sarm1-like [Pollicipes pollicipes]|uniref:LOW QUALITY PROTEIN: NAD(+) hydrolase sarm1-like n=1 Tax=Pollicipes pollicipes TaxID=41117 RepID=UPI0018850566|nr:LOW QUALITY PROTEIN: NAD(+) hydrolase sarm1-like [Pollicipes pollicipes]